MCHQNVRSLHTLNTSRYGFRRLIQVESTYYNDSLLLMKHCAEKVYNTGRLLLIIHLWKGDEKLIALYKNVTIWTVSGVYFGVCVSISGLTMA